MPILFFTLEQQEAVVPGLQRLLNRVLMCNISELFSARCLSVTTGQFDSSWRSAEALIENAMYMYMY